VRRGRDQRRRSRRRRRRSIGRAPLSERSTIRGDCGRAGRARARADDDPEPAVSDRQPAAEPDAEDQRPRT
jgi:hypothetical protein